ncbi:unnamed protein product, partial [Pocillopora meandrina]
MFPTSCIARELRTVDLTGMLSVKSSAYLRSRLLPGCTTGPCILASGVRANITKDFVTINIKRDESWKDNIE